MFYGCNTDTQGFQNVIYQTPVQHLKPLSYNGYISNWLTIAFRFATNLISESEQLGSLKNEELKRKVTRSKKVLEKTQKKYLALKKPHKFTIITSNFVPEKLQLLENFYLEFLCE